ncbi:hypothetical protein EDEG_02544 [Edhazardia aedis USNM 41457]|uniref:40S ribosomal protein S27 n=1 Tax=Edhazardia aedis (strain USNM 41457) TaxID=1003232 RepID=J9DKF8_EDHAE|nr:hypothetical protein EDEG_02544 [Edhazardia aedis USNM 41457]|eukprot:EJW03065.1 hypothetical protein EDEG_02544 [Edhazardia aedis USNM 41457]
MFIQEDLANPTYSKIQTTCKKNRLFTELRSRMIVVKCVCNQLEFCYSHSQTTIPCSSCGEVLMTPRGGRAQITETCLVMSADKYFKRARGRQ